MDSRVRSGRLVWILRAVLICSFLFLLARLAELQIIKGSYYKSLADENRIRRISIRAPRGQILARGGEILVGNKEQKMYVVSEPAKDITKTNVKSEGSFDYFSEFNRVYYLGEKMAHISGYLGEVDISEVGKANTSCPKNGPATVGQLVGRAGLEQEYDCYLSGIDGQELIEVDTHGQKIRVIGRREPIPGQDLHTTIDLGLQEAVANYFNNAKDLPLGKRGAVVVTDGSGELLAMYSSPTFNPDRVSDYLDDKYLPLFNRVVSGAYHPGSVFKLVTSAAALETNKIDSNFTYQDTGIIKVGTFSYSNWYFTQYGRTEGNINLTRAISRSTDTFFYKIGEMTGVDQLALWANKFGYGLKTKIDLPGEVSGLVPTPDWKKETKGESWFLGNTYHLSIGQGDLTATPLQVNLETSVVANGGKLCTPHIGLGLTSKVESNCKEVGIGKDTISLIKEGMIMACEKGGTAYPFFDFRPIGVTDKWKVACKTGTAEIDQEGSTHAWFTVFAPVEDPQIVVTVLVEKGGEGSMVAAPIAKDILKYYFERKH